MSKALNWTFSAPGNRQGASSAPGDICALFMACMSVEEACHLTMDWFRRQAPGISGDISLYSENHDFLETIVSWSPGREKGESFRPAECWAIRRGRPHHFGQENASGIAPCQHYETDGAGWHLCLPLMASGEVLGLIHLSGPEEALEDGSDNAADSVRTGLDLDAISESLSMALSSIKLRRTLQDQAIRDPLTQLFNRRYLEYTMQREIYQAERAQAPLVLAIMDIDHFKRFNDTHGHDAGDVLLKNVGAVLLKHMRGGDIACRFGGEEFALVYPGMPRDVAVTRLETIREQIAGLSLSHRGTALEPVTISSGIAIYPEHGDDIETLINAADKALYRSKDAGRNRVTVWQDDAEEEGEPAPLKLVHDGASIRANGRKS